MTIKVNQRSLADTFGFGRKQGMPLSLRLKRLGLNMWRHRWLYFLLILPLT